MSQLKKKKKIKGEQFVSQPLNFEHVTHVSASEIPVLAVEPPTPCQGSEIQQDAKTLQKLIQSSDFQEMLRNIVKEALEAERPKLLKEIEILQHTPAPCSTSAKVYHEPYATDTIDSQSSSVVDPMVEADEESDWSSRFSNPVYDIRLNSLKIKPNPAPRFRRKQNNQDTDDASQTEVKQKHKFGPRVALRLSKDDERECLSQALQANIVALVDRVHVNLTNLPDQLITAGHMTEDECRMLRNDITSRKDQVRYLVSRTKCRDLADIDKFLQLIENDVPDVVTKIRSQFEENKRNNVKCTTCALCQCSNNIDIKDFVDALWSIRAVSDGFYNEVVACPKPRGSQDLLWKALVDICNSKIKQEKHKVYAILFDYMKRKGNFEFIIKPMKNMLEKDGRLDCRCHSSLKASYSDRSSYGAKSSCSPFTSVSEERQSSFSGDYSVEIEQVAERLARVGGSMKERKLLRQEAVDKNSFEETTRKRLSHAASLDMLETIDEENHKTGRKGIDYINQTVEFHRPIDVKEDFAKDVLEQYHLIVDKNYNIRVPHSDEHSEELIRRRCGVQKLQDFSLNRSSEA